MKSSASEPGLKAQQEEFFFPFRDGFVIGVIKVVTQKPPVKPGFLKQLQLQDPRKTPRDKN